MAAIATVIFGLDGIVGALGKLGPVIVILILATAIITCATSLGGYEQGLQDMERMVADGTVSKVGDNPLFAALSYSGFVIMWFAAFMAELGAKNKLKEVNTGVVLSIICIGAAAVLCSIALICTASDSCVKDIPALWMAMNISPIFGSIYAVIVFCGIYTTSVPLLWTGVTKIAPEGTPKYKIVVVIGAVAGCLIACFVPYQGLVNFIYGILGYVGFILVFFMVVYDIRTKMGKNPIKPGNLPFVTAVFSWLPSLLQGVFPHGCHPCSSPYFTHGCHRCLRHRCLPRETGSFVLQVCNFSPVQSLPEPFQAIYHDDPFANSS